MNTRARRRQQVEADILDASVQLLAEHGVDGLTISKIAKAVDYTPGALYRYFPSKDAIIAELHRAFVSELEASLKQELERLDGEPGGKERALAALVLTSEVYLAFSLEHPARFRLFAVGLAEPRVLVGPEHAQAAIPAYFSMFATVSALFVEAMQCGALTQAAKPGEITVAFVLALQGPLQVEKLKAHAPAGFINTAGYARSVTDALLIGWGADPLVLAAARELARRR